MEKNRRLYNGVLNLLKNAPEDIRALNVGELIDKAQKWSDDEQKKEEEECNKVCNEFEDSYIKIVDEDGLFGMPETKYIHINKLIKGSMTTEWERTFNISGIQIRFSEHDYGLRELDIESCRDSMTAKDMQAAERISESDFEEARYQLEIIEGVIKKVR